MAEDQTSIETEDTSIEEVDQTSKETAEEKETPEKTQESVNYETKFKESQKEAIKLRKELDELKTPKAQEKTELTDDEKRIRDIIEKTEREKEERKKSADAQLKKDLSNLHEVYGDYDEDTLLKIVDKYGVYGEEGNTNWDRAMELYQQFGGKVPEAKPKKVSASRTTDEKKEVEPVLDVSKKSMKEVVDEGLKKFGLK